MHEPETAPLTEQDVVAHADLVYATCLRLTGNAQDAADVSQEVFLAWMARRGDITGSVAAWLHVTARQRAMDWLRRRHRQERHETACASQHGASTATTDAAVVQEHLDASLAELDAQSRALLLECHLAGDSQQTLAARFGLSQATVSRRLKQALERLRGALERRGVDATSFGVAPVALMALKGTACPTELTTPLLAQARIAGPGSLLGPPVIATSGATLVTMVTTAVVIAALTAGGLAYALRHPPASPPLPVTAVAAVPPPASPPLPVTAVAAVPPPASPIPVRTWAVDETLRRDLTALVETAIRHGFPDARGTSLWFGERKAFRIKPRAQGLRFHDELDKIQESTALHLHLADGTWLNDMVIPAREEAGIVNDDTGLVEVPLDRLMAFRDDRFSFPGWGFDDILRMFAPEDHPRITAVRDGWQRLSTLPNKIYGKNTIMAAHLLRMGLPAAMECAVAAMIIDQSNDVPYLPLSPSQRLHVDDPDTYQFVCLHDQPLLRLGDPVMTMRIGLASWFHDRMVSDKIAFQIPGFGELTPEKAAAGAKALLPAADRDGHAAVERGLAQRAIPSRPAPAADLAARLASWSEYAIEAITMKENDAVVFPPNNPPSVSFTINELDGLVALLDDPRPARPLVPFGPVWPMGDKALMAMGKILKMDPRVLVGGDPEMPWTDAARTANARALRAWWTSVRGRSLDDMRASIPMTAPLPHIVAVIATSPPATRDALLDRLTAAWKTAPPIGFDPTTLTTLLEAGATHPALAAAADALPVQGRERAVLTAWHMHRGNLTPRDRWFDEICATGITCSLEMARLMALIAVRPSTGQFDRLHGLFQQAMSQPIHAGSYCGRLPGDLAGLAARDSWDEVLIDLLANESVSEVQGIQLLRKLESGPRDPDQEGIPGHPEQESIPGHPDQESIPDDRSGLTSLRRCLLARLLADCSPAPERLRRIALALERSRDRMYRSDENHVKAPADLRVCDCIATVDWWNADPSSTGTVDTQRILPLELRDTGLRRIAVRLHPLLIADCALLGLPADLFPPPVPAADPASTPAF